MSWDDGAVELFFLSTATISLEVSIIKEVEIKVSFSTCFKPDCITYILSIYF